MADDKTGGLPYQMAIRKILDLIQDAAYDEGGWLPSGMELAEQFGVNRLTCLKAMKFLEREGLIASFPPKGFYATPKALRRRKIAIILEDGGYSPFLRPALLSRDFMQSNDLAAALNHIYRNGFYAQIIQGNQPEQLCGIASSFGVAGILWFFPPERPTEVLRALAASRTPTVLANSTHCGSSPTIGSIAYDEEGFCRAHVEFLLSRGHRNILHIGQFKDVQQFGLDRMITEAGGTFTPGHCLSDLFKNGERLAPLLQKLQITAIHTHTTDGEKGYLRRALSRIPFEQQPELLVASYDEHSLGEVYAPVRRLQMNKGVSGLLGEEAAKMLLHHLRAGTLLASRSISYE